MDIYFASANQGKIAEVEHFFSRFLSAHPSHPPLQLNLKTLNDMPAALKALYQPQEDGNSFSQNALIKAKALYNLFPSAVFAEDSGLEVEALNGTPGIFSARYADTDEARITRLLQELDEQQNRKARFVTALCFLRSELEGLEPVYFFGRIEGHISRKRLGYNGFGYDSVFVPNGESRTFAQMSLSEKRACSHRGRSLENFLAYIQRWSTTVRKKTENVDTIENTCR